MCFWPLGSILKNREGTVTSTITKFVAGHLGERTSKSATRKSAKDRERELRLAMQRIKRGKAQSGDTKLSIAAVAREAGITSALIHNHYPAIAEEIRQAQGKNSRAQRDAKHTELKDERQKNRELREELRLIHGDVARLASINETLTAENVALKARLNEMNVVKLATRSTR